MNSEWFFLKEAHSLSGLPNDDIPEYIFWGRSNVGKSSLINLLTKKNLAKTSKTPGRTKSLVFFQYKKIFRIVDFPGYGFSHIPKKKVIKLLACPPPVSCFLKESASRTFRFELSVAS